MGPSTEINSPGRYLGEFVGDNTLPGMGDAAALPTAEVERPVSVIEFVCEGSVLPAPKTRALRSFAVQRKDATPITVRGHSLRIEAGSWLAVVVHDGPNDDSIVALFRGEFVEGIYEVVTQQVTNPAA